jgi:hypothetical protein
MLALALLLAAFALGPRPAEAQDPGATSSGNPYVQTGVPAEATAENGVLARERAFAAGRRAAWARLATELGMSSPPAVSDAQLESMVSSIVIEQERVTPTRYAGRITVNFNPGRARGVLGSRAPAGGGAPDSGGGAAPIAQAPPGPPSTWLDAVATYRSMEEWLELQRRLKGAGAVASVQVQAIAVDRARLRLGLRAPGPVAAGELAAVGVSMAPVAGGPGETWRLGIAGGG